MLVPLWETHNRQAIILEPREYGEWLEESGRLPIHLPRAFREEVAVNAAPAIPGPRFATRLRQKCVTDGLFSFHQNSKVFVGFFGKREWLNVVFGWFFRGEMLVIRGEKTPIA